MNRSQSTTEIESIINNLPRQKVPVSTTHFKKKKIIPVLHKFFQKKEGEGIHPAHSQASIYLTPRPDECETKPTDDRLS
jgi:hypothetical protein